jgi:hypothetical protein
LQTLSLIKADYRGQWRRTGELLKTHIGEIVEAHIKTILGVFEQLEFGVIDLAGARTALKDL